MRPPLSRCSYQRREADFERKLAPKTTGTTFFDDLQKPASFTMTSQDPAGFSEYSHLCMRTSHGTASVTQDLVGRRIQ